MRFGYIVIGLGVVLSFIAAVTPHFSGAYQLQFGILVAHLAPYLVYAPAAVRWNRTITRAAGLLLLLLHGGFVVRTRWLQDGGYEGITVYVLPLVLALLLLPLLLRAARQPWQSS